MEDMAETITTPPDEDEDLLRQLIVSEERRRRHHSQIKWVPGQYRWFETENVIDLWARYKPEERTAIIWRLCSSTPKAGA
jgi:hypothetical protein